jgi:thioredoxin 1
MLRNLFGRNNKLGKKSDAHASTAAPAPSPPRPIDVTDATFGQVILSSQLAVVDFWAEWCAPCTTMSAYVTFLAADYAAYAHRLTVAALDVDENPAVAERYQVMGLPTLLFLDGGVEVDRIVGLTPYEELKGAVERLLANHPSGQSAEVHDASL